MLWGGNENLWVIVASSPFFPLLAASASPLTCPSRVYFSWYPPNGELAVRLLWLRLWLRPRCQWKPCWGWKVKCKILKIGLWGATGISSWPYSLFAIHDTCPWYHQGPQSKVSFLCWWYTQLYVTLKWDFLEDVYLARTRVEFCTHLTSRFGNVETFVWSAINVTFF